MTRASRTLLATAFLATACGRDAPTSPALPSIVPSFSKAGSGKGWDIWPDRTTVPWSQVTFLPVFTTNETPGFVDLGYNLRHAGAQWRAMQFTHTKSFALTVPVNSYLFGLLGDDWPPNTVNAVDEIHAGRLIAIEIDGTRIEVNPSSILDLSGTGSTAIYDVLPRFTTAGRHTLKYVWQQERSFYFTIPFDPGTPDPLGLGGRRVFVAGEDDETMVLSYKLVVQ